MDATDSTVRSLLDQSLFEAQGLYEHVRHSVMESVDQLSQPYPFAIATMIGRALAESQPIIAEHLEKTALSSWVGGMDAIERLFPPWLQDEFRTGIRSDPPIDGGWFTENADDDKPRMVFSITENAAKRLSERNILTRERWDAASDLAKQQAFMITGDIAEDTIDDVRQALVENLQGGTSLDGFREIVGDTLERSGIGPARVETIYRTNVQAAFRDGRETLARDPMVMEAFPYQAYHAIHDGRVRSNHLALETLGLSGTNIYRRDDPFWDYWTPPNGFNCRCGVQLMTTEAAARAGVQEAIDWIRSGRAPQFPEHRLTHIPFAPDPNFGFRGRYGALVA